jgi:hypothetical protein
MMFKNLFRWRNRVKPVYRLRTVSSNYLLSPGQEVTFNYANPNVGPPERTGVFERYCKSGRAMLVYDYSVGGEPRWFALNNVRNLEIMEAIR